MQFNVNNSGGKNLILENDLLAERPYVMSGDARGTNWGQDSILDGSEGGPNPEFAVASKLSSIQMTYYTNNIKKMI